MQIIMKQNGKLLLLAAVLALLVLLALALVAAQAAAGPQAAQGFDITWDVLANGGTTMSSTSYTMLSTSGQPVAGETSGSSYSLLSGYWTGLLDFIKEVFLPVVVDQKSS